MANPRGVGGRVVVVGVWRRAPLPSGEQGEGAQHHSLRLAPLTEHLVKQAATAWHERKGNEGIASNIGPKMAQCPFPGRWRILEAYGLKL